MWHEARRHEKLVRSQMVDNVKRHERRKVFYESIRRDPEEFMQIHGRRATIHMDASLAAAAEASNTLRKWQGDASVLIDRFDVRAHLDHIPEPAGGGAGRLDTGTAKHQLLLDDAQELQCEYERYRILIFNEYLKVSERSCLQQISATEFWPSGSGTSANIHKQQTEAKKKTAEKKAAIGFTYADSTAPSAATGGGDSVTSNSATMAAQSDSDSSEEIEIDEIDMKFDVDEITPEQGAQLNKIGARYRIGGGIFLKLMRLDHAEQENNAQIKEIDKAKLALSGRQAKADRAALKRHRATIVGKVTQNEEATTTLLSFLAKRNVDENLRASSSDSDSDDVEKTEFITSFGGASDDEDSGRPKGADIHAAAGLSSADENGGVVQGPVLPTREYRRLLELKHRRSDSVEDFRDPFESTRRRRSRSRSNDRYDRRERSSRRRRSWSRSRSPVTGNRSGRQYSRYSRSSRRSRSNSRENRRGGGSGRGQRNGDRCRPTRRSASSSSTSSSSGRARHLSTIAGDCGRQESSAASNGSASGSDSPLTIRSSMSESEKEQLEIENRKRRIRRIKRGTKPVDRNAVQQAEEERRRAEEAERHKARLAKKLRHQMQKALKKTAEELKQEEEEKAREQYKERKQREEELLEDARILRIREREKQRQEDDRLRERTRLERRDTERSERDGDRRRRYRDRDDSRDRHGCSRRRRSSP